MTRRIRYVKAREYLDRFADADLLVDGDLIPRPQRKETEEDNGLGPGLIRLPFEWDFYLPFFDRGAGLVGLTDTAGGATATFARTGVAQALLNGGTFGQVATNTARSWYSYDGLHLGYMAEGLRVNRCIRSQAFGADWSAVGTPTISAGTTVLGSVQLDTIGDDSAAALEGYTLATTFVGDGVKALGVLAKAGTSTSSVLRVRDGTAGADRLLVTITWVGGAPTVTATTGTDLTGTPQQLGTSGVFWIKLATTAVTAANANQIEVYPASDAALSVANTGTVQIGVINAEDATFPSSPIITTGAVVTRNADLLTYPTSPWFNALTGTVFASGQVYTTAGNSNRVLALTDTGPNERMNLNINTVPNFNWFVNDGGVSQADIGGGTPVVNTTFKAAACYAANDFAVAAGGAILGTDSAGTLPTVTTLYVGDIGTGGAGQVMWGTISRIAYSRRTFTPDELKRITHPAFSN